MSNQTIHLGSDHAGYELKKIIHDYLNKNEVEVFDHGPYEYAEGDDYPDYVIPAVESAVSSGGLAIVLGGSGQGEAIAANKVMGARAVVYYGGPEDILRLSRQHNNANVLSLGARFLSNQEVKKAIEVWLEAKWSGDDRHVRRLNKISNYESSSDN